MQRAANHKGLHPVIRNLNLKFSNLKVTGTAKNKVPLRVTVTSVTDNGNGAVTPLVTNVTPIAVLETNQQLLFLSVMK